MRKSRTTPTGRDSVSHTVRFTPGLIDRIRTHAKANGRSLQSEIVTALEAAYPAPIEPESVNEAMLDAAQAVLDDWTRMLGALGQKPEDNPRVAALADAVAKAKRQMDRG